ncbi:MAG: FAD-linked oxidase C-terminal domain-containing protein [Alphaproteobacteria bacterium]|nr:FAD-linked oxidase C-terminal domain-containing protein [Alphaproteobacteria bacterium]
MPAEPAVVRTNYGHPDDDFLARLRAIVGDRATTSEAVRRHHGQSETYFRNMPPDAVVFAHSTEEVAEVVKLCADHKVPIIPFGTGTSLEGHTAALHGGISIDLSEMNQVLEVNVEDLDCRVQAGVTRKQVNEYLRDTGLFFPIDPGADASLGGMAATRASGTNAVRYGTMREVVLGLTVVAADGRVIRTGGRARKSSAGYDLTRLFIGSEGTLGIITEVQLRLFGIPEAVTSAVCQYADLESAVNTVILTIQSGIPVARIELLDEVQMSGCIAYSNLEGYEAKPTLFYEFHGTTASAAEQAEMVKEISDEMGGGEFLWSAKTEERNKLWAARHDAYYAALSIRPGKTGYVTDACVPISRLAECILETKVDIEEVGAVAPLVGHVGDGNFHLSILVDPDDAEDMRKAKEINTRLIERTLAMGGTCTGEHGIGQGKMEFLTAEHGEAVSLMRAIKTALDPDNIMNPGKMLRV